MIALKALNVALVHVSTVNVEKNLQVRRARTTTSVRRSSAQAPAVPTIGDAHGTAVRSVTI